VPGSAHHIAMRGRSLEADHVASRLCISCHAAAFCLRAERRVMTIVAARPGGPAADNETAARLPSVATVRQLGSSGEPKGLKYPYRHTAQNLTRPARAAPHR
jgi:hypothetical protein